MQPQTATHVWVNLQSQQQAKISLTIISYVNNKVSGKIPKTYKPQSLHQQ